MTAPDEGLHMLYLWLVDEAGNADHVQCDSVALLFDATPPTSCTIAIEGGDDTVATSMVDLDGLSALDSLSGMGQGARMCFSNDGSQWSSPEPYDSVRIGWDLALYGGYDGSGGKAVYVRYQDVAGNWSESIGDSIVCDLPLALVTTALPQGTAGFSYVCSLQASGGWPPYHWMMRSGSLPSSLTLDSTGTISGIPDSVQTALFEVGVRDAAFNLLQTQYSLNIEAQQSGDVNGDGLIDILDVVLTVNIILELAEPEPVHMWGADCNRDRIVNILDALCIVSLILEG